MASLRDGIHSALVTPFDASGKVDHESLAGIVRYQQLSGVVGMVVNGSTGEFPALTELERTAAVETVAGALLPGTGLTVQVGAMSTASAVSHAQHAQRIGADCLLLVSPYYEPISFSELYKYVEDVAGVGVPIMLYNNPAGTGWSLTVDEVSSVADIDGVRYLKDTTGDVRRLLDLRDACGDRLTIMNGQDGVTFDGFVLGVRGAVWGAANLVPKECVLLWSLVVQEQFLAARRLWEGLYPVTRFLELNGYVASIKAGMSLRSHYVGVPRLPLQALDETKQVTLARLLSNLDQVSDELGSLELNSVSR